MTKNSKNYFKSWAKRNLEKRREYNRNWMRNYRNSKLVPGAPAQKRKTKEGHCFRCDILLDRHGGNGVHCQDCIVELKL